MTNKRKIFSLFLAFLIIFTNISNAQATNANKEENLGKTIVINMNRTNLDDFNAIPALADKLESSGYIGLMNIKGDGGNDDKKAYATIGAGRRAYVNVSESLIFSEETDKELYKATVNRASKLINLLNINRLVSLNESKGTYGGVLGSLGQTLTDAKLKVAVLGNADTGENVEDFNRNIGLIAMDEYGRIELGNIDDINIEDGSASYGISTDYKKLIEETKKYYEESDVLFVELGDTHRLDLYKEYLNDSSYADMRAYIYNNINNYLEEVFGMVGENDTVYVMSAYVSKLDYKEKKRLAPVIKFEGEGKGLLYSNTVKRDGIIGNVDICADILSKYNLENSNIIGYAFEMVNKEDNLEYISSEFEKIVSVASVRTGIISFYIFLLSFTLIIATALVILKNRNMKFIKNMDIREKVERFINSRVLKNLIKELLKISLILPLSFLIAPTFGMTTEIGIVAMIIMVAIVLYAISILLRKKFFGGNEIKQILFISALTVVCVVLDCLTGTNLMKNSIFSYDAIVGARYYGMGNEYQGLVIGASLFTVAAICSFKKLPKLVIALYCLCIMFTTASPLMGANVGASISEFVAFVALLMLLSDTKINLKKVCLVGIGAVVVIAVFAVIDKVSGSSSHLSLFVGQIFEDGPVAIIQTFSRKISMNLKIFKTSSWAYVIIVSIISILMLNASDKGRLRSVKAENKVLYKGFIANLIGCVITLLVNDSGVLSAAIASMYVMMPLLVLSLNKDAKENIK